MTSLLDIVPSYKKVRTSFGELDVPGISIQGIVTVLKNHPEILEAFKSGTVSIDLDTILGLGLDISSSIMAAGLGFPGNKEAEEKCKMLTPEDAMEVIQAIIEVSFPSGLESFFVKTLQAAQAVKVQLQGVDQTQVNNSQ